MDIIISGVTVAIHQAEAQSLKRVRWRNLGHFQYPIVPDTEMAAAVFSCNIVNLLKGTFSGTYKNSEP